jgi:hypothetical protein
MANRIIISSEAPWKFKMLWKKLIRTPRIWLKVNQLLMYRIS